MSTKTPCDSCLFQYTKCFKSSCDVCKEYNKHKHATKEQAKEWQKTRWFMEIKASMEENAMIEAPVTSGTLKKTTTEQKIRMIQAGREYWKNEEQKSKDAGLWIPDNELNNKIGYQIRIKQPEKKKKIRKRNDKYE